MARIDRALENLLDLDGFRYVIDEHLGLWVKIEVRKILPTINRPHGIKYSFTLHDRSNTRIMGFDNAHMVSGESQENAPYDHWHKDMFSKGRIYKYESPGKLITDFWIEVERLHKELGDML